MNAKRGVYLTRLIFSVFKFRTPEIRLPFWRRPRKGARRREKVAWFIFFFRTYDIHNYIYRYYVFGVIIVYGVYGCSHILYVIRL